MRYAFAAAWEKDGRVTSADQWRKYLERLSAELESPLRATVKK